MLLGSLTINSSWERVLEPNKTLLLLSWCRIEIHKGMAGSWLLKKSWLCYIIVLKIATWVNQSVFRFVGNVIANNKAEWRDWDKSGTGECGGNGGMRFVRNFSLSQLSSVLTIKSRGNTLLNKWRCLIAASAAWASATCHLSLVSRTVKYPPSFLRLP